MTSRSSLGFILVSTSLVLASACGGSSSDSGNGGSGGYVGGTGGATGGTGGATGGTGGATGGTGGATGGTGGATGGTGGNTGGAAGATGGAAGATGGAAGSAGAAGSGGASGANLVPSIDNSQIYLDCMPIVGADPVDGTFDAKYDNSTGTAADTATVTSATLHLSKNGATLDWTFSVTPATSGSVAAGATTTVTHTKTPGSGSGSGTPCSFCGGTSTLSVDWTTSAGTKSATTQPASVLCAL